MNPNSSRACRFPEQVMQLPVKVSQLFEKVKPSQQETIKYLEKGVRPRLEKLVGHI